MAGGDSPAGVTVPEVCRSLRLEPTPRLIWTVGAKVREEYRRRYGTEPPKALRRKTKGSGSHCFAIYGPEMRPVIETLLKHESAQAEIQGTLL